MKSTGIRTFALLFALCHGFVLAQDTCGPLGNRNNSQVREIREQRFYLDINNPAPCTGNITSWRVCYYGPEAVHPVGSYWATYGIYRRMGSDSESNEGYERVSEIFSGLRTVEIFVDNPIVDGEIEQGGFNCYEDFIDVGDSLLTVQAGDILGACVFDDADSIFVRRLPLDIVGEISGDSLLAMNTNGCDRDDLPTSIPIDDLSSISSRRLHMYASIEPILTPATTATVTVNSSEDNDDHVKVPIITTAVLSAIGCLTVILIITMMLVVAVFSVKRCSKHKQKSNIECNAAYTARTLSAYQEVREDCVNAEDNIAYGPFKHDIVVPTVGATTEQSNTDAHEDELVQNVAYASNQSVISVSPNVAYSSHQETTTQEDDVEEYMYI